MRIIGGTLGGRRFPGPAGDVTRPTSERVREAMASALDSRGAIEGARVLDLFTGTGALAFEALSRGARDALLVDRDPRVVRAAKESIRALGLTDRARAMRLDLLSAPQRVVDALSPRGPFDLVFADPPYARIEALPALFDALAEAHVLSADAFVVAEFARSAPLGDCRLLASIADYRYGDTSVRFLRPPQPIASSETHEEP